MTCTSSAPPSSGRRAGAAAAALLVATVALAAAEPPAAADAAGAVPGPDETAAVPAAGRLHPHVGTAAGPGYALYLPSGYTPEHRWPVLYLFDSRRQGAGLAELFQPAAERFGFVLASALDSAGVEPTEHNLAIARAMWVDTHERLALDGRRAYAAGFSGMARFACTLEITAPGTFAAVLALNGGFPVGHAPGEPPRFPVFATVGDADFNYYELLDVEEKLRAAGVPQRLELFSGSHQWPPADLLARAVGWLELQAMREGRRPHEAALVASLWEEELARARAAEARGGPLAAFRAHRALVESFQGLRDTAAAERRLAALAADPDLRTAQRAHEQRLARDRRYLERAPALLLGAGDDVAELLAALDVPQLQARARGHAEREERLSAERVLYAVYIQTALYLPRRLGERGEHERALFYLAAAAAIEPEVPQVRHRQAVAHARLGRRREALRALERAVELGWDAAEETLAEEAFAPLRDDPAFRALVTRMRQAPQQNP